MKRDLDENHETPVKCFQIVKDNQYLLATKKPDNTGKIKEEDQIKYRVIWINKDDNFDQKEEYDYYKDLRNHRKIEYESPLIQNKSRLGKDEVKNDLSGWILGYFEYYFRDPFAIYNIKG